MEVHGKDTIKVLVDETRVASVDESVQKFLSFWLLETPDWRYSFDNYDEDWGYGSASKELRKIASIDIMKKGELDYITLRDYDVMIMASFEESYSSTEMEAIRQFVENGGGLFVLAAIEYPNNSIARTFDVLFQPESVVVADEKAEKFTEDCHQIYIHDTADHPITYGIDRFALNMGIPISSYESGAVLMRTGERSWADMVREEGVGTKEGDEKRGPFDLLLAMEIGRGRALFFGGAWSFFNWVIDNFGSQNLDLLDNAVKWLAEPGGPYKQCEAMNEQAQQVITEALSLYVDHQFSQARSRFEEAAKKFEESNDIYPNREASTGIEKASNYMRKCEIGMSADEIFDTALDLFNEKEYDKAIEEFERARLLYEEINYTERVKECVTKMEAVSLFQEGEDVLSKAPSTFSTIGYETAQSLFGQSKSKWEEHNNLGQIAACEEKIKQCSDEIARIRRNRIMAIVGVAAIVIVVVVAVIIIFLRKRRPKTKEDVILVALKDQYAKGKISKEEYEQLTSISERKPVEDSIQE